MNSTASPHAPRLRQVADTSAQVDHALTERQVRQQLAAAAPAPAQAEAALRSELRSCERQLRALQRHIAHLQQQLADVQP